MNASLSPRESYRPIRKDQLVEDSVHGLRCPEKMSTDILRADDSQLRLCPKKKKTKIVEFMLIQKNYFIKNIAVPKNI